MKRNLFSSINQRKMKDQLGFRIVLCSAVFIILTQNRALADLDSESHEY